jgi:hypothetical protein
MRPAKLHAQAIASLAAVAILCAHSPSAATGEDDVSRAEALIRKGVAARRRGNDSEALPFFRQAYEVSRSPRTAAQLGLVELALGYFVEAEAHLGEALAATDHPWIEQNRKVLAESLRRARSNVGELGVDGGPPAAEVIVGGRRVGTLPLAAPIRVPKGPVEVELRAPGHVTAARSLVIRPGRLETVSLVLEPIPAPKRDASAARSTPAPTHANQRSPTAPAVDAPPVEGLPREAGGPRRWPVVLAWTFLVGSLASTTFAVLETVSWRKKEDEFRNLRVPRSDGMAMAACGLTEPNRGYDPRCAELYRDGERARVLAIGGYVGAAAFMAGSVGLFVLARSDRRHGDPRPALACGPVASHPGLSCRLAFE